MWKDDKSIKTGAASAKSSELATSAVGIGRSVVVVGELAGTEDLTIEGHVEGRIDLRENVLTVAPRGKVHAEVFARAVVVLGEVVGRVMASERVDIRATGSVEGDIWSPRLALTDGAHFRGGVEMVRFGLPHRMLCEINLPETEHQTGKQEAELKSAVIALLATFGYFPDSADPNPSSVDSTEESRFRASA